MQDAGARKKQRIGFLWDTPHKVGERCIRRQVVGSTRFEAIVISAGKTPPPPDFPLPVFRLSKRRKKLTKLYRKYILRTPRSVYNQEGEALLNLTCEQRIRLVHVFFGTKAIKHRRALQLLDAPVTVSFHGADVAECAGQHELFEHLPELFDMAASVMVRSEFMGDKLAGLGCPRSKLWINRTGIPLDEFPFKIRERRPEDPIVFMQAGRLIPKKGLGETIEAFDRVRRELGRAELWIAGKGELKEELATQVQHLRLADAVRFLGFLDTPELVRYLHEAHVFVHPSVTTESGDQEGVPNSMLEAMATGLPPITTRHAGIPEAVVDGETGWLVDEHSPREIADRMLLCARDPGAVLAAGRAARRFVEQHHALDAQLRMLDQKYGQIIDAHARTNSGRPLKRLYEWASGEPA